MQRKKENLAIGLQIKQLRQRLGLDRAGFCRQLGGLIACRTLQLVELGHQKPSQKVLCRIAELEKGGIVGEAPVAVAKPAAVVGPTRCGTHTMEVDDTEQALLKIFRRMCVIQKARLLVQLHEEFEAKRGPAPVADIGKDGESPEGTGTCPSFRRRATGAA